MLIGIVLMVWAYWTDALGTSGVQSVSGQMLPTLNEVSIMDDLLILRPAQDCMQRRQAQSTRGATVGRTRRSTTRAVST